MPAANLTTNSALKSTAPVAPVHNVNASGIEHLSVNSAQAVAKNNETFNVNASGMEHSESVHNTAV